MNKSDVGKGGFQTDGEATGYAVINVQRFKRPFSFGELKAVYYVWDYFKECEE